jgi:hypothetical protein
MRTIYHPTLPVSKQVPEADIEAWKEAGWRVTDPAKSKSQDSPAAATAADQGQQPEKE